MGAIMQSEIAVIGLGTMGNALVRNLLNQGFSVAGYNRSFQKTKDLKVLPNQKWTACQSLKELIANLQRPRKIILMLPAGKVVDEMIDTLLSLLDKGDILLDGGNSYFEDTERRFQLLESTGIYYFGLGVSGGEEGALNGPSLMPSGDSKAYDLIKPYLESIAAKEKGQPCCTYIASGGAGHYVKMVHNGIEYADMQLLAEVYLILKQVMGLENHEIAKVFEAWNKTELRSYLVEISAKIFLEQDPENFEGQLIDAIVDKAGQKGTGSWTAIESLRQGQAVSLIEGAVNSRIVSNLNELRETYKKPIEPTIQVDKSRLLHEVEWIKHAYYLSKRLTYAQGFALMYDAGQHYGWQLDLSAIAAIFRNGCIIQAKLLEEIMLCYAKYPTLEHLFLSKEWQDVVTELLPSLRKLVVMIVQNGIAAPLITATLTHLDQISAPLLGANLIQAQRDFFGAHTFERKNIAGKVHHEWNK